MIKLSREDVRPGLKIRVRFPDWENRTKGVEHDGEVVADLEEGMHWAIRFAGPKWLICANLLEEMTQAIEADECEEYGVKGNEPGINPANPFDFLSEDLANAYLIEYEAESWNDEYQGALLQIVEVLS